VSPQLETHISGIYAVGDLIGGMLLAHKASQEGIVAAENVSGSKKSLNYRALPNAVYTEPEFSSVGLTEEEAREMGIKTQVGVFSLQANGRALAMGKSEGMVKIVADEKDKIIGSHLLAPMASEIMAEMTLAVTKGMKLQEVSSSIHIHPTLSEAVMEAALNAKREALHVLNI
jgi:dihydrolipoamide dehydrogenase